MTPTFDIGNGSYFGGKNAAGVVHRIINQIPRHDVFVSGFLGRCAVTRYKLPAPAQNIGFDLDAAVIADWRDVPGIDVYKNDFLTALRVLGDSWTPDTFLYLDPPYLLSTRTSGTKYRHEMTDAQHVELLDGIRRLGCMVALSCYDNPLYAEALADWRKIQFPAQTRRGTRIETLYMNYPAPAPDELHDRRYLGENFRAREKAKRRILTIQGKILRLNPEEKARLSDWLRDLL